MTALHLPVRRPVQVQAGGADYSPGCRGHESASSGRVGWGRPPMGIPTILISLDGEAAKQDKEQREAVRPANGSPGELDHRYNFPRGGNAVALR